MIITVSFRIAFTSAKKENELGEKHRELLNILITFQFLE